MSELDIFLDRLAQAAARKRDISSSVDDPSGQGDDEETLRADVVVVTALQEPEKVQVLRVFGAGEWSKVFAEGVLFRVTECSLGGRTSTVAVACQTEMGMVPAAVLCTKALSAWDPRYIVMTGICAAATRDVNLGDIIVAQSVFDYGSGKVKAGRLHPDYSPVLMDPHLNTVVTDFAGETEALQRIRSQWPTSSGRPDTALKVHVGAFASGAAVVADEDTVEDITNHKRSLYGIDMEAYGVARAAVESTSRTARFLIAKAAVDYADEEKADDWQEYGAFVSAQFVYSLLDVYASELFGVDQLSPPRGQ